MKKNKLCVLALTSMVALSSFSLFACKDSEPHICDQIEAVVQEIENDSTTYKKARLNDSNFVGLNINGLHYNRTTSENYKSQGDVYNTIFALSYSRVKANYSSLKYIESSKLNAVKKAFKEFKKEYDSFIGATKRFFALESDASDLIYNGYFVKYMSGAKSYIDKTSELSEQILYVTYSTFKASGSTDPVILQQQKEAKDTLKINYELQKSIVDIKNLIFNSAKGQIEDTEITNGAKNTLNQIADMSFDESAVSPVYVINETYRNKLNDVSGAMNNQRKIVNSAINNFSIYDYVNFESLDAYCNNDKTLFADYNQLNNYFSDGGYLANYITNLKTYLS